MDSMHDIVAPHWTITDATIFMCLTHGPCESLVHLNYIHHIVDCQLAHPTTTLDMCPTNLCDARCISYMMTGNAYSRTLSSPSSNAMPQCGLRTTRWTPTRSHGIPQRVAIRRALAMPHRHKLCPLPQIQPPHAQTVATLLNNMAQHSPNDGAHNHANHTRQ